MTQTNSLLNAVYSDPGNDAPRHVLADHLIERGDERGEFIALQLARAKTGAPATKREVALLKKHQGRWVGPLDGFLSKHGRVFSRGFLSGARAEAPLWGRRFNKATFQAATGVDEWATVESFSCPSGWPSGGIVTDLIGALLVHPVMRSLRTLHNAHSRLALLVATGAELTEVGLLNVTRDDERALAKLRGLTALASSEITIEGLDWLLTSPLWKQLSRFSLRGGSRLLPCFDEFYEPLVKRAPASLQTLSFAVEAPYQDEPQGWHLTLRRDASARFTRLHAAFESGSFTYAIAGDGLANALERLAPTALTELHVEPTRAYKPSAEQDELLRKTCRRFKKLTSLELPESKR